MGFNISGIVINKNFDKDVEQLRAALDLGDINFVEEVSFEQASKNWTPEGEVNIHFTDKATLVFLNYGVCTEGFEVEGAKALTYAHSSTSGTFVFFLWDGNSVVRSKIESEGEIYEDSGDPLDIEDEESTSGSIFNLIDDVLGMPYFDIDLGDTSYRYSE